MKSLASVIRRIADWPHRMRLTTVSDRSAGASRLVRVEHVYTCGCPVQFDPALLVTAYLTQCPEHEAPIAVRPLPEVA